MKNKCAVGVSLIVVGGLITLVMIFTDHYGYTNLNVWLIVPALIGSLSGFAFIVLGLIDKGVDQVAAVGRGDDQYYVD